MAKSAVLLLSLFGISAIKSQTTTECDYVEIGETFYSLIGLFPGQYAAGYCTTASSIGTSETFECDSSDDGYYYEYDEDYCAGSVVNVTAVTNETYVCGSTDTCDVYTITYVIYNDTNCSGPTFLSTQSSLLDTGSCFPLTELGVDAGSGVVSISTTSYTLITYNDSSCSVGYSEDITLYPACYNVGNTSSLYVNITDGGSGTPMTTTISTSNTGMSTSGTGMDTTGMDSTGTSTTGDDDDGDDDVTDSSGQFDVSINMVLFVVFSCFGAIFSAA